MDKIFGGSSPELNRIAQNLEELVRQFANSTTKRGMVDFGATRRFYIGAGTNAAFTCPASEPHIITHIMASSAAVETATIEINNTLTLTVEIDKASPFVHQVSIPLYPGDVVDCTNTDVTWMVSGVAASDV